MSDNLSRARAGLSRVQKFDSKSLVRAEELGNANFQGMISDADSIIYIFNRIPVDSLHIFSPEQQRHIAERSESVLEIFQAALDFDPLKSQNPAADRDHIISRLSSFRTNAPDSLAGVIAYANAMTSSAASLELEFKSKIAKIEKDIEDQILSVTNLSSESKDLISRIRDAAAEQGVSQQAIYFGKSSDIEDKSAKRWLIVTSAVGAITLSTAVLFVIQSMQMAKDSLSYGGNINYVASKFILIAILVFLLNISARNFLSHKHNSKIDKHRQNSLLTYQAFVDAAPTEVSREIVLTHAAASVYSQQDTGFIKNQEPSGASSVLELLTRSPSGVARSSGQV